MPVIFTESYWKPIEEDLRRYFTEFYWSEILTMLQRDGIRVNSKNALIAAIRAGTIRYSNGTFSGTYSASISRYLSRFAKYDGRAGTWTGTPPTDVSAAAAVANNRARTLNTEISRLVEDIPATVAAGVDRLKYSIEQPLFTMSDAAGQDLQGLGISADITPELSQRLIDEYTTNQNLNIVNWTPDQVERLRNVVYDDVLNGYNRDELRRRLVDEYGVTMRKARFLARQETSLLLTEVRDERYSAAGVEIVRWSNSGDVRVVGNPAGLYDPTNGHGNHWVLGGKFCKLSDPTVYADTLDDARSGRWKSKSMIGAGEEHAGREFGCRCTYIPVL